MAIAIEGATVVVRLDRAGELLERGLETLSTLAPNGSALSDEHLWKCSFMVDAEAERFLLLLAERGLNANSGAEPDAILVDEYELEVTPYCEWLKVARVQKGVIGWLDGTVPKTVVARNGWSFEEGSGLTRYSETDDKQLEFVKREGTMETYFDKSLNKEVYLCRQTPSIQALNAKFKQASGVIKERMIDPGQGAITGESAQAVALAVRDLEEIVALHPDHWQSSFFLGKGKQALGDTEGAYQAFQQASQYSGDEEGVLREFAGICLHLGRAAEAVQINEKAAALQPSNPLVLGNLACAYLIAGRLPEARKSIDYALKLDAADVINRRLAGMIDDVASGQRPQPRTLLDLMRKPPQEAPVPTSSAPRSLWHWLMFWKK